MQQSWSTSFKPILFHHIYREHNKETDRQLKEACSHPLGSFLVTSSQDGVENVLPCSHPLGSFLVTSSQDGVENVLPPRFIAILRFLSTTAAVLLVGFMIFMMCNVWSDSYRIHLMPILAWILTICNSSILSIGKNYSFFLLKKIVIYTNTNSHLSVFVN